MHDHHNAHPTDTPAKTVGDLHPDRRLPASFDANLTRRTVLLGGMFGFALMAGHRPPVPGESVDQSLRADLVDNLFTAVPGFTSSPALAAASVKSCARLRARPSSPKA